MRVLHPVSQRETFVASGVYRYIRGAVPAQGEERFSIHALPDGSWFVRVDYDWRVLDGTSQLIEALIDPPDAGGRFQRVVAQLQGPTGLSRETYDFHPGRVLIGVTGTDGARVDHELSLPESYAVLLLKTTLAGIAAARWPAGAGTTVTAFGGYRSDEGALATFDSALSELRHEEIAVGRDRISARVVELVGDFTQTLWLDSLGVALRRELGEVRVELHNYSRRAEQNS